MAFGKAKSVTAAPVAPDILEQKKNRLDFYNTQFNCAVSLITDTIDNLGRISQGITETMQEIDNYAEELAATKNGLTDARAVRKHRPFYCQQ